MSSEPRVVLITGTSGAIGGHLARTFLERAWTTLGVDRHAGTTDQTPGLIFTACDLSDAGAAAAAVDAFVAGHGPPDVLINCAGQIANAPLVGLVAGGWASHDPTLWRDVIASNLTTAFYTTSSVVSHMLRAKKKGVIINITSVCARGNAGQSAYSAAKAGLNGLTMAWAKELGPLGIRVVSLSPGYFDTTSTRAHMPAAKLEKVASAVPLKRLGALEEITSAVDFIVGNAYVTGTIVDVHGGLVL